MLVINPDERWGSKKVLQRLKQILNQNSNPKGYYCSSRARGTFHPSPLLRLWDESSYDQRLLYQLNDKAEMLTYSGLQSSVDLDMSALPDSIKHGMELFDVAFLSQSTFSVYGPSRSPTTTTIGTDTAPGHQRDILSETSSFCHDPSSREASVDFARGAFPVQHLPQLDTTNRTPGLLAEASGMSSMQVSTDFTEFDTSQDPQYLCTPSKSHGPLSSKATSVFTHDMRRSMSSCTGRSTLDPDDFPEQIQLTGDNYVAGPDTEAMEGRVADDNLQVADKGESSHNIEMAQKGNSHKDKSVIQRTWASLRRRFKAVWKQNVQSLRRRKRICHREGNARKEQ